MWESVNSFFNRLEQRAERTFARLHKLERLMEDFPGRPHGQSMTSALGIFTEDKPNPLTVAQHERRALAASGYTVDTSDYPTEKEAYRARTLKGERAMERASMAAAEELRKSFRPKAAARKFFSHVRPMRPVPVDVVAWARLLGVSI